MKVVGEMNLNELVIMIMFCLFFPKKIQIFFHPGDLVTRSVTPRGPEDVGRLQVPTPQCSSTQLCSRSSMEKT